MSADAFIDTNVFVPCTAKTCTQHGQRIAGLTIVDPFRVSDS